MAGAREEIEKEIIKFLDENSSKADPSNPRRGIKQGVACALGTSQDNVPRVTPIDFYNDGLTLWMTGDPGGKIENIRANPNVSLSIYNPIDRSKVNRSIMLKGKASLVTYREQEELYMEVVTRFGILDSLKQSLQSGLIDKQTLFEVSLGEDFETKLNTLLNRQVLIKIEPELIAFLIMPPGGIVERLVWEKEG